MIYPLNMSLMEICTKEFKRFTLLAIFIDNNFVEKMSPDIRQKIHIIRDEIYRDIVHRGIKALGEGRL